MPPGTDAKHLFAHAKYALGIRHTHMHALRQLHTCRKSLASYIQ